MTLKELRLRHESGEKQVKTVKLQIKEQLNRKCAQRGCDESLAFKGRVHTECAAHKGKTPSYFANPHKTTRKKVSKAEMRAANKLKKKRFYERHGIKFDKTIRQRDYKPTPKDPGVELADQTLLYDNYKEPLKKIEKGKGYGYYGTVAITADKEYVQCHICGNLFTSVSMHLRKHKISAVKYKETYGLSLTTSLMSEPAREAFQKRAVAHLPSKDGLPAWLQEYNRKVQSGEVKHKAHGRAPSLEWRNKNGLCPDQVLEKIKDLTEILGHTPSHDEFARHYKGRYLGSINFQHGSYLKAVAKLGLKSAKELKEYTNEQLLENLVQFYDEHGRIPMTGDFNRGLLGANRATYITRFGSLNSARVEAGLNAVIPMPFGQIIELSPEQYSLYEAGKPIDGLVSEASVKKRRQRKILRSKV